MYVCQFPLAVYYERVARARAVKFSRKIKSVQPFVVLKFQECATSGAHARGASLPHFGSGRRRKTSRSFNPRTAPRIITR